MATRFEGFLDSHSACSKERETDVDSPVAPKWRKALAITDLSLLSNAVSEYKNRSPTGSYNYNDLLDPSMTHDYFFFGLASVAISTLTESAATSQEIPVATNFQQTNEELTVTVVRLQDGYFAYYCFH